MGKSLLRLDWCSHEAAKYACKRWHYSRKLPVFKLVKIGVWENKQFIGAIVFSLGNSPHLLTPYGLKKTEGCELSRVALREHINPVSRMIAISLKMLKKSNPGLRLVVSYADAGEGHHGGIYQATNWIYTGKSKGSFFYEDMRGKVWHPRTITDKRAVVKPHQCKKVWKEGKHRYVMPLDDDMRKKIQELSKPYPKKGA